MILSSNKTGVETGVLAAAKATGTTYQGYTHKPDGVSEIFGMDLKKKVYQVSKQLIAEADFIIFIGPDGRAYRKLKERAGNINIIRIDCKEIATLADISLKNKKVYITGAREHQFPGIMHKTFDYLRENLRRQTMTQTAKSKGVKIISTVGTTTVNGVVVPIHSLLHEVNSIAEAADWLSNYTGGDANTVENGGFIFQEED